MMIQKTTLSQFLSLLVYWGSMNSQSYLQIDDSTPGRTLKILLPGSFILYPMLDGLQLVCVFFTAYSLSASPWALWIELFAQNRV